MINFFRKIRQRLLTENKFSKYLLYAIGEIILVVIGILIALQINNWNEEQKVNREKAQLIESMITDFELSRVRLASSIALIDQLIYRTETFLSLSYRDNEHIPIDSLKNMASAAFDIVTIEPVLTSYNEAIASGKISSISNKQILSSIAEFLLAFSDYKVHYDISGQNYYLGSVWEIRREIGNLGLFLSPEAKQSLGSVNKKAYQLSEEDFRSFLKRPIVYASWDNQLTIYYNIKLSFETMDKAAQSVIEHLETM